MENLLDQLAHNIKSIREEKDLSQNVLSERSGLDRTYLGKIERGERVPSLETLESIAKAVGVEPSELLRPLENGVEADIRGKTSRLQKGFYQQQRNYFMRLRDLVKSKKDSTDDREAGEILDEISSHLNTMTELYNQLLSHGVSEESTKVNFSDFLETVLEQINETLNPPEIDIELNQSITPNVELYPEDAVICVLVLHLLMDNAYKHAFNGSDHGSVDVSFRHRDKDRFILTVADDGLGGVTDNVFDGTLSGLNIVKELVTYDLRGELTIHSDSEGTEVSILFARESELDVNPEDAF